MGTKVQCKSYLSGYYPMRDLNEDSNSCSWSLYYEDKGLTDGQYYNGYLPKVTNDAYPGYDKDSVKQKMLEHEAIFKNQVYELHRLYRVQRDMMHRNRMQVAVPLSSSPLASSQMTPDGAQKWTNHGFPLANSGYAGPSISGVVKVVNSPLSSSAEGNNVHASPYSSQNIEVLESRPSKVRRRMFDLQLPADEYIDTEEGEQTCIDKVSNRTMPRENGVKFYLDDGRKNDARLRSPNGFADLNEPIQLEDVKETNASSPYSFNNGKIYGSDRSVKPNSQLLGLPNEISLNSYGRNVDAERNLHLHRNGNGKGNGSEWFSHAPEVGQRKSFSQFPQVTTSKGHQPTFYLSDKSKGDFRKEETVFTAEISRRPHNLTNEGNIALHRPQIYRPELAKPWPHSWEKPSSHFDQKPFSVQMFGAPNMVQRDGILGDKWYLGSNGISKPAFAGELPYVNGFNQGSSSGSKEQPIQIPSSSVDYPRYSKESDKAPGHWTDNGSAKYIKASSCVDMKSPIDMNLNVVMSDSSCTREVPVNDRLSVLPWLRPKPACKTEVAETSIFQSSPSQSPSITDKARDCNLHFAVSVKSSSSSEVQARIQESSSCRSNKKLLGFPIFEKPNAPENDLSFIKPPETKVVNKLNRILDINLPCDPTTPDLSQQSEEEEEESTVVEKVIDSESACFRHHIDLNSCLSDDEVSLKPSAPITEIDLEAPAVAEFEEDVVANEAPETSPECDVEVQQDELITVAAEAIVAISASVLHGRVDDSPGNPPQTPQKDESASVDPLMWFVEIVSSGKLKDDGNDEDGPSEEFDYFESMILGLAETKEEDYMPAPMVPESEVGPASAAATTAATRSRKGQARRGRQRRDFQRDILPGLASLSRHEVTEDLQLFGGLMRATGHSWHSGLARRSSARGRRRRVAAAEVSPPPPAPPTPPTQILNGFEAGPGDRSLTGWGKTTRRPRRQRCTAGNATPVVIN